MKDITFKTEARTKLIKGLDTIADAVKCTLGPKGRNVVIQNYKGTPNVTKDGVTVAKNITLVDQVENLGAEIAKQASKKTADLAGDGTTTSMVLAQALVHEGSKLIDQGFNPIDIKRAFEECLVDTVASISDQAENITDNWDRVKQVARISANSDHQIGDLIADTFQQVGSTGVITVEDSNTAETYSKKIDGIQLDRGYLSPYFISDRATRSAILENPLIFITDKKLRTDRDIKAPLEEAARQDRPIFIIAEEVEANALNILIQNQMRGNIRACVIKTPWYGKYRKQILSDLCASTGATLISKDLGYTPESIESNPSLLGSADKIITNSTETIIIKGHGEEEAVKTHKEDLLTLLADPSLLDFDKEKLRERYGKMSNQIAILYVGASTEIELREKKDRIDDALCATRSALKEGIVAGGGQVFLNARNKHPHRNAMDTAFNNALSAPFRTICENAGKDYKDIALLRIVEEASTKIVDLDRGYDANAGSFTNLKEKGIIDPAMVSRLSIENAVSVASAILMTETAVTYHIPDQDYLQGPNPMD
tara:strand:+ start:186 stop:1808 length:1623 start_codon:yes stop_codon:yes gene_type:complete